MINNIVVIILYVFIGSVFLQLSDRNSYKRRSQYATIVSLILILQSGLRNVAVGVDTYGYYLKFIDAKHDYTYEQIFQNFNKYLTNTSDKDYGYIFLEKFFSDLLNGNFQIFLILIACLFFFSLRKFILNNTRKLSDIILAYVIFSTLYFSFYSITGIRQTIAMSIVMFSIPFIKTKKFLPFLSIVLIALTIHKSSIIFICFYFLNRFKNVSKYIFLFVLLMFPLIMSFKGNFLVILQSFVGYEVYQDFEGAGTFTFTFLFLLVSIFAYFKKNYLIKNNDNADNFFGSLALCLVFLPLSWINPNLIRILMYFSIYLLVIIPELINSLSIISIKITRDLKVVVVILLILMYMKSNSDFQYRFFWDDMKINNVYYVKNIRV